MYTLSMISCFVLFILIGFVAINATSNEFEKSNWLQGVDEQLINDSSTTFLRKSKDLPIHEEKLNKHVINDVTKSRALGIDDPLDATDWETVDTCYPTAIEKIEKYAPVFDFDTDSCLPAAAISSNGEQNKGLEIGGSITGGCRSSDFLNRSNTYHKWNRFSRGSDVYEAHMFELYFEKDQTKFGSIMYWNKAGGHKHDLENVLIMFKNEQPYLVGVSSHGSYISKSWSNAPKQGTHVKVVYHSDDGGFNTHAFRFAKSNENNAENPSGRFVTPPLVSWYHMTGNNGVSNAMLRNRLNELNFGSANMASNDWNFASNVIQLFPTAKGSSATLPFMISGSWFSEEGDGFSQECLIARMKCGGRYCDNLKITCGLSASNLDKSRKRWTGWFSEEKSSWTTCPPNYFVYKIECGGRYCDNKDLLCAPFKGGKGITVEKKYHVSEIFSEEQGPMTCPMDYYVVAMKCSGRYCDNLRVKCQKAVSKSFCQIDEQTATAPLLDQFQFYPYYDSNGGDLKRGIGGIDDFAAECYNNPNCKGFNSNGWLKHTVKNRSKWSRWTNDSSLGFYLRK